VEQLISESKQAVGNQLLETRVILHLSARTETGVRRVEQRLKVRLNLCAKTLKVPHLAKKQSRNDQNVLNLLAHGHNGILSGLILIA
jgi:hypothetical protein